ncbi:DUF1467 family protein [Marinivivus vitaminiproducens]|uniref:DUF1467 family protein n=1 Tax=Marinivivus vitaminiproducens TaxID=3035935 RepID=UPI0027AB3992|nr:DUF1467 family protein [Geminicoccaceae bacterium SCSIO 64248]
MNLMSLIVTFVVIWWLVLFMVLPFGAQPPDEVEPGMADSAPAKPRIALKFAITTAITIVLTVIYYFIATSGLITFRDAM